MNFYAGIDGGGTKTEAAAIDEQGVLLCRVRGGSTNPHAVGFEKAFMELTSIFRIFFDQPQLKDKKCLGICLGMSGIDSLEERSKLSSYLKEERIRFGANMPFEIRTEGEIALTAALGRPYGLQVIAGTGSIVYGFLPGEPRVRAGGWGHLLGDEGSGYRIGLEALRFTAREFDRAAHFAPSGGSPGERAASASPERTPFAAQAGTPPERTPFAAQADTPPERTPFAAQADTPPERTPFAARADTSPERTLFAAQAGAAEGADGEKPPSEAASSRESAGSGAAGLAAAVREALGLDTPEALKRWAYAPGTDKAAIAALAEPAVRACEAGDPDARRIVEDEAAQLAATTAGLLRGRPQFAEGDAVLGGSLFGHSPSFREAFAQALAAEFPRLRLVDGAAGRSAAEGAALLARQIFGG